MVISPRRPPGVTLSLLALFLLVSALVVSGRALQCDEGWLRAIGNARTPQLTESMLAFTLAGDGALEVPLGLGIALLLWRLGHPNWARRYLLVGVSGELLYLVLKPAFHRPRPEIITRLGEAGWYSYPSGHAMMAPIIWTFGFLLLARAARQPLSRAILVAIAVVAPIAIASSRVYLGVHYPSDVLGALLIGAAWAVWWWPGASEGAKSASTSAEPAIR